MSDTFGPTVTPSVRTPAEASDEALPVAGKDRYVVERELGQGGQSIVFAARDTALNRDVALKTARQHGDLAGSFVREARITGQLEHPGIVPVHELGRTLEGEFYCTQKLVRGRTFRRALEEATTLGGGAHGEAEAMSAFAAEHEQPEEVSAGRHRYWIVCPP